jgi:hypothetical protein
MASGTNGTFRQIGIAAGIAALGSIFTSAIQRHLSTALPPSLAGHAGAITAAIRAGSVGQLLGSLPAPERGPVAGALRSSFAVGLNDLLYVTAGVALVGGVCAMALIRQKDFVARDQAGPTSGPSDAAPEREPEGQPSAPPRG